MPRPKKEKVKAPAVGTTSGQALNLFEGKQVVKGSIKPIVDPILRPRNADEREKPILEYMKLCDKKLGPNFISLLQGMNPLGEAQVDKDNVAFVEALRGRVQVKDQNGPGKAGESVSHLSTRLYEYLLLELQRHCC